MSSISLKDNKIFIFPNPEYPAVKINIDPKWTLKVSRDSNGDMIGEHKLDFDIQEDRDFFCDLFDYPVGLTKSEFEDYFKQHPIGKIYYNDTSPEIRKDFEWQW